MLVRSVSGAGDVIACFCLDGSSVDSNTIRLFICGKEWSGIQDRIQRNAADVIVPLADMTMCRQLCVAVIQSDNDQLSIVIAHVCTATDSIKRYTITYSLAARKVSQFESRELSDRCAIELLAINTSGSLILSCDRKFRKAGQLVITIWGERFNLLRSLEVGTEGSASYNRPAGLTFCGRDQEYVLLCSGTESCTVSDAVCCVPGVV